MSILNIYLKVQYILYRTQLILTFQKQKVWICYILLSRSEAFFREFLFITFIAEIQITQRCRCRVMHSIVCQSLMACRRCCCWCYQPTVFNVVVFVGTVIRFLRIRVWIIEIKISTLCKWKGIKNYVIFAMPKTLANSIAKSVCWTLVWMNAKAWIAYGEILFFWLVTISWPFHSHPSLSFNRMLGKWHRFFRFTYTPQ